MNEFDTVLDRYQALSHRAQQVSSDIQTVWQDSRGRAIARKYLDSLAESRVSLSAEFNKSLKEISEADRIIGKITEQYGIFGRQEENLRKSLESIQSQQGRAHEASDRARSLAVDAERSAQLAIQFIQKANSTTA